MISFRKAAALKNVEVVWWEFCIL